MKGTLLLLEHRHNGRVLKKLKLPQKIKPIVIGSSIKADIRLAGTEVSPYHACLESRSGKWYVFDFASTTGTWVNKESIVEFQVEKGTVVKIGLHELYLQPVEPRQELFTGETNVETKKSLDYHQIILRTDRGVVETQLLPRSEAYQLVTSSGVKSFAPPSSGEWVTQTEGKFTVQQRLTSDPGEIPKQTLKLDNEMRWPFFITTISIVLLAGIFLLHPGGPEAPKTLPELQNNKFASLIYDAKVMAEKKKESQQIIEKKFKGSAKGSQGNSSADQVAKGKANATKLISQVKAKGLSQLIGKIAKRASNNTLLIGSLGRTADSGPTGRAVAAAGNLAAVSVGNTGADQGKGYKLAAIGTGGKGGGGNYKEGTGLGSGNIGSSNVGIVEEESEVSGGLDKDIIAEVIRSELGQIRYCYERQLSGNPDLYGKVLIKFTIGTNGAVVEQRIGTTTLKNADVEGCILRRVARWKFPTPKGGTTVLVSYPFLFKSTN